MSNKTYGLSKERQVKKILEERGYQAYRCRGSFGIYDIIARNDKHWKLIQVKATKLNNTNYSKDIAMIQQDKAPINTFKELWVWKLRTWQIIEIP